MIINQIAVHLLAIIPEILVQNKILSNGTNWIQESLKSSVGYSKFHAIVVAEDDPILKEG